MTAARGFVIAPLLCHPSRLLASVVIFFFNKKVLGRNGLVQRCDQKSIGGMNNGTVERKMELLLVKYM
jgi:hypothetical protein